MPPQRRNFENSNDIKKYVNLVLRNWYWFVLSVVFTVSIAKLINVLSPRIYRVQCDIIIGEETNGIAASQQISGSIDFNQANPVNKEIGIIKSKNLAEQTIAALDFKVTCYELLKGPFIKRRRYNELPFVIVKDSTDKVVNEEQIFIKILSSDALEVFIDGDYNYKQIIKYNEKLKTKDFSFKIVLKEDYIGNTEYFIGNEYMFYFNNQRSLVNEFWRKLIVGINPTSQNILTLSMTGENINQAIAYLSVLTKLYIENDLVYRNRMASNTIDFIDGQLAILSSQLQLAEDSLINYKREHKLYKTEVISTLPDQYLKLEEEIKYNELEHQSILKLFDLVDSIKSSRDLIIPLLSDDSKLNSSINDINQLVIERGIIRKNQKNNSPDIILLDQKIDVAASALKSYIKQEEKIILSLIETKKQELFRLENELINLPATERQLMKLTRDFEMTENLYNLYQQKRIEAKLAKASTVSNMRMLDPPEKQSAVMVSPKEVQNIQLALILGLLIPLALLVIIELASDRIRDVKDLKVDIDIPVIGKLSHSSSEAYLPAKMYPWSAITESFRTLHAKLKYILPDNEKNIIAITSASSSEGKTFCAMNLSTVMASAGKKVVLIGLDLRRPKIEDVFQIDNQQGLTTYLIGNTDEDSIIHSTDINNLYIINSGPIPPNPVELIENNRMNKLLENCSKNFDFVIIDSPPVGLVADALLINKVVNLYLFVVRIDYTKKAISGLLKELTETGSMKNLSLVFNDIRQPENYVYGYYNNYYQKEESQPWWSKWKFRRRYKK